MHLHTHTPPHLTALFPGLPRWAGTGFYWILLKQETVSGSGISWAICKSAPCSRQTTTPAPHHSVFYRPDELPAAQPTESKHWRHALTYAQSDKWTMWKHNASSPMYGTKMKEQPVKSICRSIKSLKMLTLSALASEIKCLVWIVD